MKLYEFIFPVLLSTSLASAKEPVKIRLSTFEVPPFFSNSLPEQGAAAFGAQQVFKGLNYKVDYQFFPIRRAKLEALKNPKIVGYIPCSEFDVIPGFVLSSTVFQTKTVLIEKKKSPILWDTPHDLQKYRGSLGRGYSLKGRIKSAYDKGHLQIEEVPDDISGILRVAMGRADYHFMADGMFKYLISKDPRLKGVASKVQMNSKPAANVSWGICFKEHDKESMQIMNSFNAYPGKGAFPQIVTEYLKKGQSK